MAPPAGEARKRELRRALRERPPDADRRARACRERLLGLAELATAHTVALYCAQGHEVPVGPVADALLERGVRVVLPRLVGAELDLHGFTDPAELVRGPFGLLEPPAGASSVP